MTKGRERLKEKFTMEQTARKNEDYYYSLLERNGTADGEFNSRMKRLVDILDKVSGRPSVSCG